VAVASDKPQARALDRAAAAGIAHRVFERDAYPDRAARDGAIADWLDGLGVELVVLAGYMALLHAAFIARFRDRIVNVHPALLPRSRACGRSNRRWSTECGSSASRSISSTRAWTRSDHPAGLRRAAGRPGRG